MIVFQIKGQSHRLSTLKGKEKDVVKFFFTYSTNYTEDTEVLGRQLSQARSKPDLVVRVRTAHYIGVHYDVHNYDAQQHRAGQIIFPPTLPDNHYSSDVVCWRGGWVNTSQHLVPGDTDLCVEGEWTIPHFNPLVWWLSSTVAEAPTDEGQCNGWEFTITEGKCC